MIRLVIDANIVLSFLEGEVGLFEKIKKGDVSVFAPNLLLVEVSNVLLRKKKLSLSDTNDFLTSLLESGINFVDFSNLKIKELTGLADKHNLTTYDGIYLFLAMEMGIKLLSYDKDLLVISDLVVDKGKVAVF